MHKFLFISLFFLNFLFVLLNRKLESVLGWWKLRSQFLNKIFIFLGNVFIILLWHLRFLSLRLFKLFRKILYSRWWEKLWNSHIFLFSLDLLFLLFLLPGRFCHRGRVTPSLRLWKIKLIYLFRIQNSNLDLFLVRRILIPLACKTKVRILFFVLFDWGYVVVLNLLLLLEGLFSWLICLDWVGSKTWLQFVLLSPEHFPFIVRDVLSFLSVGIDLFE